MKFPHELCQAPADAVCLLEATWNRAAETLASLDPATGTAIVTAIVTITCFIGAIIVGHVAGRIIWRLTNPGRRFPR